MAPLDMNNTVFQKNLSHIELNRRACNEFGIHVTYYMPLVMGSKPILMLF